MLNNFFSKIVPCMRSVERYSKAGQATNNMAHAHCILNT